MFDFRCTNITTESGLALKNAKQLGPFEKHIDGDKNKIDKNNKNDIFDKSGYSSICGWTVFSD